MSLILEADGTDECLLKWTGNSGSRPALSWRGKSIQASVAILLLTQGHPQGYVGKGGWNGLHICSGSYGNCLNWRHLYWGTHQSNMYDYAGSSVHQTQTERLPLDEGELLTILTMNRADWPQMSAWKRLIVIAKMPLAADLGEAHTPLDRILAHAGRGRRSGSLGRQEIEEICAAHSAGFDVELLAEHFAATPRKIRAVLREWCGLLPHTDKETA